MLYQVLQYFKFIIQSKNEHGVHSPFLYNMLVRCFYDKTFYEDYRNICSYRKALIRNKTKLEVSDLGAGSRVMHKKQRCISKIAKTSGSSQKRAKLLYRLTRFIKPKFVLELGTSLGISTYAMHKGYPSAMVTTIEGCENIAAFTEKQLKACNTKNISLLTSHFDDILQHVKQYDYDIIFLDGNHQEEATLRYFETLLETVHNDSIIILDDIYWSKGMTSAWKKIQKHHKVTLTVDTFFWGFVFFRKEQSKQHFRIRL